MNEVNRHDLDKKTTDDEGFKGIKELERFFGGDVSWYPGGREKMMQDLARASS